MKGAHSVKKKQGAKKSGGNVALVVACILVLALVGVIAFMFMSGVSQSQDGSSESVATGGSSQDADPASRHMGSGDAPEAADESDQAPPDSQAIKVYANERFGFSVDVPDGFVVGSQVDDGDGIVLTNNALRMTVTVVGFNNDENLDVEQVAANLWNNTEDSIVRTEGNRVVIYQYDADYEYFIWSYVGSGSIDQMTIRYPLQDDNRDELDAAQELMQGFIPGDLNAPH